MKTKEISSFFVLFALAVGVISMTPGAFADHAEVIVEPVEGSSSPGCEETECFSPSTATVDVGGKVIFSNTDTGIHTFVSGLDLKEDTVGGIFESSIVNPGETFEWSPTDAGDVAYFCSIHPWMKGMITVQEVRAEPDVDMMMPEGDPSVTGMLPDDTMVSIWTSEPTADEMMEISIMFADSEHVNYDIMVMQDGNEVLTDKGVHSHDGMGKHMTQALDSSDPVDITVTFQGFGVGDSKTGPIGEEVVFPNVVPEFGTIAMMILAVAIISIVAVTAKSRIMPRF